MVDKIIKIMSASAGVFLIINSAVIEDSETQAGFVFAGILLLGITLFFNRNV